ncbi:MAG: hypothetical protein KC418_13820 [Anaerolineales bacterium]|nr:hypothetical protein [Anaerolineales bacterium]
MPALIHLAKEVSAVFGHDEYAQQVLDLTAKCLRDTSYQTIYRLLRQVAKDQELFKDIAQILGEASFTTSEMAA